MVNTESPNNAYLPDSTPTIFAIRHEISTPTLTLSVLLDIIKTDEEVQKAETVGIRIFTGRTIEGFGNVDVEYIKNECKNLVNCEVDAVEFTWDRFGVLTIRIKLKT